MHDARRHPDNRRAGEAGRRRAVQLLRAVRAGKIAEPPRCGPFRAWKPSDLPRVVEGLRRAGYLKAAPAPG
jgi:hypothetical protein